MKKYGHFSKKGYVITDRNTPRHWYNYLFNDEYITSVSQVGFGHGFAQDNMGHRLNVVRDRIVYVYDGKEFRQATGLPVHKSLQSYQCTHAIGYTDIAVMHQRIRTECRFFVPSHGKREFLRVSVTNESKNTKTLKVLPYYETDADFATFNEDKNCVIATQFAPFNDNASACQYIYMMSSEIATSHDTRLSAFLGTYGNKFAPSALIENGSCTDSVCIGEKACMVLENTVTLCPGESKTFYYTIGVECSEDVIPQFLPAEIEEQFAETLVSHHEICDKLLVHTPWEDLDALCNDWLKYQSNLGSYWSRINNQLREATVDTECLSCFDPHLAEQRLCRLLKYQYESGYAPHSFMNGVILDNDCSDSAVWLIFAAHSIVKELGTVDFLLKKVPFNNGTEASVYEHLKRALNYLWNSVGHQGLSKILAGDANIGLDNVGIADKGVSVWLSVAFVRAAKMFSQMANWVGSEADSKSATHFAQVMESRVNTYAFDEDRYICAISDNKQLIGSKACREGSLFALPQIWSVLARFDPERTTVVMNCLEAELNTDLGLQVCNPPYTNHISHIGSITDKAPGMQENGGISLLLSAQKIIADSMLGRNDKIEETLRKILPEHHEFFETQGEPYALGDYYFGKQTGYRCGTADMSWVSGAGQLLLYALVRHVYGLQPEFGGLMIRPVLPTSWRDCSVTKVFRGCKYNVHYIQKEAGTCNKIEAIYVNGSEVTPQLPIKPQANKTLNVEVILKSK